MVLEHTSAALLIADLQQETDCCKRSANLDVVPGEIQLLQGTVHLQHLPEGSGCNIAELVPRDLQVCQCGILVQSLSQDHSSKVRNVTLIQDELCQPLHRIEDGVQQLAHGLDSQHTNWVVRNVELLDVPIHTLPMPAHLLCAGLSS